MSDTTMFKQKPPALGFATTAIHHAYDSRDEQGALNPPMHLSSTFTFDCAESGGEMFAGEKQGHFYSRISNPTLDVLEKRMARLEGAEAALSTASGMGASTSVLWTLLQAGDHLIADKTLYGCTYAFMQHGLKKFGVDVEYVDMTEPAQVAQAITSKTRVIYFETPANPNMRLIDIKAMCDIASAHHITTVVDNTYATPLITQPISLGADLVIHSATKYLGGHGDLIAGIVVGSQELIHRIRCEGLKDMTGACMSPFTAMLIMRGLKTLEIRMQRHSQSALHIASYLEQRPEVKAVHYPGLLSHPQYHLACEQMAYFGGMIAFELQGDIDAGKAFMNELSLIQRAVSLGDAESLIQHPASMTHSAYTAEERAAHGISDGLIRLSVGLENERDIVADLERAFVALGKRQKQKKQVA